MKKIAITLLAAALATSAFAKTQAELLAEWKALAASDNNSLWTAQVEYTKTNKADCLAAFNTWKTTDFAKWLPEEDAVKAKYDALGDAQKADVRAQRRMFSQLFSHAFSEMDASDAVLVRLTGSGLKKKFETDNPTFYTDFKAADFSIDGVKLPRWVAYYYANLYGDCGYVVSGLKNNPADVPQWAIREMVRWGGFARYLTAFGDNKLAYETALAVEGAIMGRRDKAALKDISDTVREYEDFYYLALTRANKIK